MIPPNHENVDAWSKLVVAGMVSPGVVRLAGHKRPIGWDDKAPKGTEGGTSTRTGAPLGAFTATFYLVDEIDIAGRSDFDDWDDFQTLLESSTNGKDVIALEIYHPDLARNHYTAVVLGPDGIGDMVPDGKGGATITVAFKEHRPEAKKTSGSATSTQTQPESAGDKAVREAEAELDALLEEGKDL